MEGRGFGPLAPSHLPSPGHATHNSLSPIVFMLTQLY